MAGGHASPILEPAKHDLDAVSPLVVLDRRLALHPAGDAGAYPFVFQRVPEPFGAIVAIIEQPVHVWQTAVQSPSTGLIANLPGGNEQIERGAFG